MKTLKKVLAFGLALASLPVAGSTCVQAEDTNGLTSETVEFYNYWKEKYIVNNKYTDSNQYYVWYSDTPYSDNTTAVEVTVSEAHGYGMLITAAMAEYDDNAKEIFDGMYLYYKAHPSEIGSNLMAWQQQDDGTQLIDSNGANSATDGDLDIAYALLMADSVWGSDGNINYKQSAIDVINDIMEYEVNKKDWILQLGDWAYWSKEGETYYTATRTSDFYNAVYAGICRSNR